MDGKADKMSAPQDGGMPVCWLLSMLNFLANLPLEVRMRT